MTVSRIKQKCLETPIYLVTLCLKQISLLLKTFFDFIANANGTYSNPVIPIIYNASLILKFISCSVITPSNTLISSIILFGTA